MGNENNKRGNGIFLGIVSIATLIIAAMGATFAWFSASTVSDPNAVNLGAYEFKLDLKMRQIYPENANTASGLIPLDYDFEIEGALEPNNTNLLYAINVAKDRCVDDNGLQVCALYEVSITNQGSNSVTLTGQLLTTSNNAGDGDDKTPFQNLAYQAVTGDLNSLTLVDNPIGLPKAADEDPITISNIIVSGAEINPDTGEVTKEGKGTGYVLIYLNDIGDDQSSEMGATYEGQLKYTSGGTGNTLTGKFKVGNDEETSTTGEATTGEDAGA